MNYAENRVRVAEYGSLPATSPLLVPVPTAPGHPQQRAHVLAARAAGKMAADVERDLGIVLTFASGWRPKLWPTFEAYHSALIAQYKTVLAERLKRPVKDDEVVAYGRTYRAFESPHQTGLALDIGCGGLAPISATIPKQKKTTLYQWLVANMWRHGFTPYLQEPWHIELRVPLGDYRTPPPDGKSVVTVPPSPNSVGICEDGICETP